ncbi:sigma-70 RNA polymerase sigma factor region 4 domain-containing protein [Companilactobacillus baiquanensis]|uniref:Sigma-70 family RNA polymerase sigma factor n=1 Tax=Companilactobacillus baiquanensis TaxID=2486005 RepID=A0ABW1UV52_9LACO|nr:sigma-70 family RNA polymerase sigma factor [Companilactobacillus baiquanensis]
MNEQGFISAIENERLIYGALKRVHIYPTRIDYEDYFQEAVIIYALGYEKAQEQNNPQVYLYQSLVWKLTDLLRKEKVYKEFHSLEEFDFQRVESKEILNLIKDVDLNNFTKIEIILLQEHFINQESLVILAKRYNCSTRNLRYWRSKLRDKLRMMVAS